MSFFSQFEGRWSVTRSYGFAEVEKRVRMQRERPEFAFLRHTLPRPPRSASEVDRLEYYLLSIEDDEYERLINQPTIQLRDHAPNIDDPWEREYWESQR